MVSEDERRAFETDGLTAYRQMPLAVVLPSTTAEVAAVMAYCHAERRAGRAARAPARRSPAAPSRRRDAIILGVGKMTKVLDLDFDNRTARVQSGHHQPRHLRARSPTRASSTPPTRRASSPARSRATSR